MPDNINIATSENNENKYESPVSSVTLSVTMKSGHVWTGSVRIDGKKPSNIVRARRMMENSVIPLAENREIPVSVFLDVFYMFKASAGCSHIETKAEERVSRSTFVEEGAAWLSAVESLLNSFLPDIQDEHKEDVPAEETEESEESSQMTV